jgi:hypothetical protein
MAWTLTAMSFASHESRDPGTGGRQPGAAFERHEREPGAFTAP